LGSTKGSSALCLFHKLVFRYHAPYLIFTHFGLWEFYRKQQNSVSLAVVGFYFLVDHFNKCKV
jgi:hypothetical protein